MADNIQLLMRVWYRELRKWVRWHLRRSFGWHVNRLYWSDRAYYLRSEKKPIPGLEKIVHAQFPGWSAIYGTSGGAGGNTVNISNSVGIYNNDRSDYSIAGYSSTGTPIYGVTGSYTPVRERQYRYVYVQDDRQWIDVVNKVIITDFKQIGVLESTKVQVYNPSSFAPKIVSTCNSLEEAMEKQDAIDHITHNLKLQCFGDQYDMSINSQLESQAMDAIKNGPQLMDAETQVRYMNQVYPNRKQAKK
jgi:hypothetical protein